MNTNDLVDTCKAIKDSKSVANLKTYRTECSENVFRINFVEILPEYVEIVIF